MNFSKGLSTGMVPHFREGEVRGRVLETSQLSLVPGRTASQGWETLLEASSEFGHLKDRAGWVQCGLWLRARISASLVQLDGQEVALDTRGKRVVRGRLVPQIKPLAPGGVSVSVLLGPGLCPCFYLPKCPAGREPAAKGTNACEDTSPPLCPGLRAGTVIAHQPAQVLHQPRSSLLASPPPLILQNPHVITGWD